MTSKTVMFLLLSAGILFATEISITGTIKDEDGKTIPNALIRFEKIGYVTVSNSEGGFVLSETSPVIQPKRTLVADRSVFISNNIVYLTVGEGAAVSFTIVDLQGKLVSRRVLEKISAGSYHAALSGLFRTGVPSGMYIVSVKTGGMSYASRIVNRPGNRTPFRMIADGKTAKNSYLARKLESVDEVTISKLGYVSVTVPVESYTADIGTVTLKKSSELGTSDGVTKIEDSLFNCLMDDIAQLGDLNGPSELKTIDFISVLNGFEAILETDSMRMKSNIGYMIASLASLNVNSEIWKIADSLDAYFSALPGNSSPVQGGSSEMLMKKAMEKSGVLGLGKAMAVKTPQILMGTAQNPSFPKFLTVSYLQNVIEKYLIPVLDDVLRAAGRVESSDDGSLKVTADGETYEIDKGEVYIFDASVNLLRAYCYMMCIYDMDLFTSDAQKDYSWIDTLVNNDDHRKTVFSISGDTLYGVEMSSGGMKNATIAVEMLYYNLEDRESFLTIRKPFHEAAYTCLRAVPAKIKSGLAAIRAETDDQSDDILKIEMIDSANSEMLDLSGEIRDEGFSAGFAEHFSSIDKLMDFINELLSGPVTFDEVLDGKQVALKVNLSAIYTNPVEDLRTLLPRYTWTNKDEWFKAEADSWNDYIRKVPVYNEGTSSYDTTWNFSAYNYDGDDEFVVNIDQSLYTITSQTDFSTEYALKTPVKAYIHVDSSFYFDALCLKDGDGNIMSNETIQTLIDNKMFFPYFEDYTFHGLFPDMTRQKWLDLLWSE